MLSVLAQCEMTMEKTAEVYDMHAKEQEHYEMLNRQIGMSSLSSVSILYYLQLDL